MNYLDGVSSNIEFKLKIFKLFKVEIGNVLKKMNLALKDKNFNELADLAHKAKSSVSILGMDSTSIKMKELETDVKSGIKQETYTKRVEEFIYICNEALKEIELIESMH